MSRQRLSLRRTWNSLPLLALAHGTEVLSNDTEKSQLDIDPKEMRVKKVLDDGCTLKLEC